MKNRRVAERVFKRIFEEMKEEKYIYKSIEEYLLYHEKVCYMHEKNTEDEIWNGDANIWDDVELNEIDDMIYDDIQDFKTFLNNRNDIKSMIDEYLYKMYLGEIDNYEIEDYFIKYFEKESKKIENVQDLEDMAEREGLEELQDYIYIMSENLIERHNGYTVTISYKIGEREYLCFEMRLYINNVDDLHKKDKEDIKIKIVDVSIE